MQPVYVAGPGGRPAAPLNVDDLASHDGRQFSQPVIQYAQLLRFGEVVLILPVPRLIRVDHHVQRMVFVSMARGFLTIGLCS